MSHKVAAIQMTSGSNVASNLLQARELIKQAASAGAQLAVLPEIFPIMSTNVQDRLNIREEEGKGMIQEFLASQAKENTLWIIGGTIPLKANHADKFRAACLVYNEQGQPVARYDKIHLFDVNLGNGQVYKESAIVEPGNRIKVIDTPFGKIGLTVCYDIRFPGLFMEMAKLGAEIITIPAAFTVPTGQAHWELLARARAVENFSYVIGACQGGKHDNGRETYGHSLIVEPWGSIIASLPDTKPGVIVADVDLNYLREKRKAIPIDQHQRIGCDSSFK